MRISSSVYRLLYENLWDQFYAREWKGTDALRRYSQSLWQAKEGGRFIVREKILNDGGYNDERYLYRKYNDLRHENVSSLEVDDMVLCRAWEYLGFEVASGVKDRGHLRVRTKNLLEQFQNAYAVESTSAHGTEREVERVEKEEQMSLQKNRHQSGVNGQLNGIRTFTNPKSLSATITSVIIDFFENIDAGKYEAAWKLLTPAFQNRQPWHGDVTRFAAGYDNTLGIRDILVFHTVQRGETVVDVLVCYDEEVESYSCADLGALRLMTVSDLQGFVQSVNRLQDKIHARGKSGFENMELRKLFHQTAAEYIGRHCMIQAEDMVKAFPVRRTINSKHLCQCTCKLIGNGWLINGLRSP